jgi:hypothetical protein
VQRGGVEFCVAKIWHLNYALRNDVIDFGHLVQVSHFDLRLIITRIALGGCIPRRILCRFLEGKCLCDFLPVSGRALPIRVAKKPRMLLATRDSPSRPRLPPGPCCPRVSTVPMSRCTVWLTPATYDRSCDAAHAIIWSRGLLISRGGFGTRHAQGFPPLHWWPPSTSLPRSQSRSPRLR